MYLNSCNNLSKNISIILSLTFLSAGAFASGDTVSPDDINFLLSSGKPKPSALDALVDKSEVGAATDADASTMGKHQPQTCVYKTGEEGYKRVPDRVPGTQYTHSISFSGAAFRYPWHFGVAAYLQEKYNDKLPNVCFLGASAGAMVSTLLACNVKIANHVMGIEVKGDTNSDVYTPKLTTAGGFNYSGDGWLDKVYRDPLITESITGVYGHIFDALRATNDSFPLLLDNSCGLTTNKATFSLTNITSWWPTNERINQFASKPDLIDYALASGHLPFLVNGSAYATVNGQKYVDGGITDNQPVFNNQTIRTIRVWPYMGTIWGSTALSWLSLYGNSDMERNRGIYMDGYTFAKSEDEKLEDVSKNQKEHGIWAPLN